MQFANLDLKEFFAHKSKFNKLKLPTWTLIYLIFFDHYNKQNLSISYFVQFVKKKKFKLLGCQFKNEFGIKRNLCFLSFIHLYT